MVERLANSWELAKASARVLRADKELLLFPLVSAIASLIVALMFLVPAVATGLVGQVLGQGEGRSYLGYLMLFLFYLCEYAVVFYFNTALVGAALIRLQGGDPRVRDGFRLPNQHLANIVGYAIVGATVGILSNVVLERSGKAGRALARIGGLAWSLATFLVVPVLVAEGLGPIAAVKRSAELLKRTWGEQIVGTVGLRVVFALAFLLLMVAGVIAIVLAGATEIMALVAAAFFLLVLALIGLGLVQGALNAIYTAALYRFAQGQDASQFFPADLLAGAFEQQ